MRYFTFKHLMSSSSLPSVCVSPRVAMRGFLPGALQRKVAEAAEPQAPFTCRVSNSPWADTGKVREWKVQEGSGSATWRCLGPTSAILECPIDRTQSTDQHHMPSGWVRKSTCSRLTFPVPHFNQGGKAFRADILSVLGPRNGTTLVIEGT